VSSQAFTLDLYMSVRRRAFFLPALAVCGIFFVSACALPPVIAFASYAATGLSYLTSGKAPSDHVLSAVAEQDCALFRVVMGENICRGQGDQPVDGTVIASADGRKPWDIELAAGAVDSDPNSNGGSGDYFDNPDILPAIMLADAVAPALKGVLLGGLKLGTEIFALLQDDGALEIFAHDPALVEAPENMRMVLKIDDYAKNSASLAGVRLNGKYYAISDILV
jgi:hypothetical protein